MVHTHSDDYNRHLASPQFLERRKLEKQDIIISVSAEHNEISTVDLTFLSATLVCTCNTFRRSLNMSFMCKYSKINDWESFSYATRNQKKRPQQKYDI